MSLPAETKILDELELRLRSITTDNGYSMTIENFERGRLEPFVDGDIPAINYWPVSHPIEAVDYGEEQHTLRVVVDARDILAAKQDGNFPDQAALMIADIITAILRAPAAPKVSDALDCDFSETVTAIRTPFNAYQIGEGQRPWVGAIVEIEIEYKSPVGDMFNYQP